MKACPILLATLALWVAGPARAQDGNGEAGALPPLETESASVLPGDRPPDDRSFRPWTDWAAGQQITPLRRFSINLNFGSVEPGFSLGGMESGGANLRYAEFYDAGPALRLEASYNLAPFLSVTLGYFMTLLNHDEGSGVNRTVGSQDYNLTVSDWAVSALYTGVRLRFPLAFLGSDLFRFSRAVDTPGLAPFLRFDVGSGGLGAVTLTEWNQTLSTSNERRIFENTRTWHLAFGGGLEIRWSWGSVGLELGVLLFGAPSETPVAPGGAEPLSAGSVTLTTAIHF